MLQQIGFATISKSPNKLWSENESVFPEPKTIMTTPANDRITPWTMQLVIFSTLRNAPKRIMNIGVVAKMSAELVAVVSAMPWMKKS